MSVKDNYPAIRPSLLLDFANTKALDPRITFSRASTGTYYDGKTFAKAEENLLTYSEQFDQWTTNSATITANDTAAPDGTTTADKLTCDVDNAGIVFEDIAPASGIAHTFSAYLKAGTHQYGFLSLTRSNSDAYAVAFDLSAGTVVGSQTFGSATATSNSITSVGNGWYRCSLTATISGAKSSPRNRIGFSEASPTFTLGSSSTDATVGATLFIWGAQIEQRSSVTAYTATTTQPITNYIPVLQTAASGEARFDHDPVTGESKGLLIEEQRTNIQVYSEEFDNAAWTKARASIDSNTIVAPDGTLTGSKLIESTDNDTHTLTDGASVTSGTSYTYSIYAKAGERSICRIYTNFNQEVGTYQAFYDLSSGTVTSETGTGSATITPVGNGWYRITSTVTATASAARAFYFSTVQSGTTASYTGDGYSGVYIWGAQLEVGAFPTSYIKTTSAQATRSADSASMTGTNFSSWYRQDEGTLYAECSVFADASDQPWIINDGTSDNRIILIARSSTSQALIDVNDSNQVNLDAGSITVGEYEKYAFAYKVNDFALSLSGSSAVTDSSGSIPVVNQASFSSRGHIKKVAYYPARLTNAQLQGLTS